MNFLKKIFGAIKNSYFKSLRGEENFWVVLFGWGIGLYIASLVIGAVGFVAISNFARETNLLQTILLKFWLMVWVWIGFLGLVLVLVYPFVFSFSLMRCAIRSGAGYVITAIIALIILLRVHYAISIPNLLNLSLQLVISTINSGVLVGQILGVTALIIILSLFAYIIKQTLKTLLTKNT